MQKLKYLLFFLSILCASACNKETALPELKKIIKIEINGYVIGETLEFLVNGKFLGEAIENRFKNADGGGSSEAYIYANDEIIVRKKKDGVVIGKLSFTESPFFQKKKIYYDGASLKDNLALTPVSDPNNIGFRLQFKTTFPDFYGGPVDIEFFEETTIITRPKRSITYKFVKLVAGVTESFGDFYELPFLKNQNNIFKRYVFKVYKAGTKELPYTKMDHVKIPNPDNSYGVLGGTVAIDPGKSMLLSISPILFDKDGNQNQNNEGDWVSAYFSITDVASAFN